MKERGIPFRGDMVRAILAGRKTQTRRIVKPQPGESSGRRFDGPLVRAAVLAGAPYKPGDRLYVKQTWAELDDREMGDRGPYFVYKADTPDAKYPGSWPADEGRSADCPKWKSSRFMPRRAARIWLDVLAVRVERVQDISEADAMAEGCIPVCGLDDKPIPARVHFSHLWDHFHGDGAWARNDLVYVYAFGRAEQ